MLHNSDRKRKRSRYLEEKYLDMVHAEGVSKNAPKDIERRADFMYTHYYIFIPNTPENERP